MSNIYVDNIEELVEITAGLVQQGMIFNVRKSGHEWVITFTGGF